MILHHDLIPWWTRYDGCPYITPNESRDDRTTKVGATKGRQSRGNWRGSPNPVGEIQRAIRLMVRMFKWTRTEGSSIWRILISWKYAMVRAKRSTLIPPINIPHHPTPALAFPSYQQPLRPQSPHIPTSLLNRPDSRQTQLPPPLVRLLLPLHLRLRTPARRDGRQELFAVVRGEVDEADGRSGRHGGGRFGRVWSGGRGGFSAVVRGGRF